MDNQHKKIKGYRDLSQEEIDLMNEAKELAEKCRAYIEKIEAIQDIEGNKTVLAPITPDYNTFAEAVRWLQEGKRDLQVGFMKIVRSIARPETF